MVARLVWDQEVESSNLSAPICFSLENMVFSGFFRSGRPAEAASALPRRYRRGDFAGRKFAAGHRPGPPAGRGRSRPGWGPPHLRPAAANPMPPLPAFPAVSVRGWGPPQNSLAAEDPMPPSREFRSGFQKNLRTRPDSHFSKTPHDFAPRGRGVWSRRRGSREPHPLPAVWRKKVCRGGRISQPRGGGSSTRKDPEPVRGLGGPSGRPLAAAPAANRP